MLQAMPEDMRQGDHQIRQADVSRLPFMAGVLLAISGLLTLVLGLYTLKFWWGWWFIALGILVAGAGCMLLFRVAAARLAALAAALVSLVFGAIFIAKYPWFGLSTIGLDLVAIYCVARSRLGYRGPGE